MPAALIRSLAIKTDVRKFVSSEPQVLMKCSRLKSPLSAVGQRSRQVWASQRRVLDGVSVVTRHQAGVSSSSAGPCVPVPAAVARLKARKVGCPCRGRRHRLASSLIYNSQPEDVAIMRLQLN